MFFKATTSNTPASAAVLDSNAISQVMNTFTSTMANLMAAITETCIPQAKDGSCTTEDILEKVILPLASPDRKTATMEPNLSLDRVLKSSNKDSAHTILVNELRVKRSSSQNVDLPKSHVFHNLNLIASQPDHPQGLLPLFCLPMIPLSGENADTHAPDDMTDEEMKLRGNTNALSDAQITCIFSSMIGVPTDVNTFAHMLKNFQVEIDFLLSKNAWVCETIEECIQIVSQAPLQLCHGPPGRQACGQMPPDPHDGCCHS